MFGWIDRTKIKVKQGRASQRSLTELELEDLAEVKDDHEAGHLDPPVVQGQLYGQADQVGEHLHKRHRLGGTRQRCGGEGEPT